MKTLRLIVDLEYDDEIMHGNDESVKQEWFFDHILLGESGLILHSNDIGDCVGDVKVLEIKEL